MTALLAFLIMLAMVGVMAIGVMFGRKPISGSCGGMKALGMDVECEICGGDPSRCDAPAAGGRTGAAKAPPRGNGAAAPYHSADR